MKQFWKFGSILAVMAVLVVMGLSTQPQTVQAQATAKTVAATGAPIFLCTTSAPPNGCAIARTADRVSFDASSDSTIAFDNVFSLNFPQGGTAASTVEIYNLDLPRVTQKVHVTGRDTTTDDTDDVIVDGPDANPKTITLSGTGTAVIEAVHKSSDLSDARLPNGIPAAGDTDSDVGYVAGATTYQVKAFNGNRIRISHSPGGGAFDTVKTVTVDNVRPNLLVNSPAEGLIVTEGVDLVFSADITDGGSGYTRNSNTGTGDIEDRTETPGNLSTTITTTGATAGPGFIAGNNVSPHGGVRLVVAGNVVALNDRAFTKIDGGWRVTTTINSTAIQGIAANIPWYFETRDRAGNVRRTSGSITGKTPVGTKTTDPAPGDATTHVNTINVSRFASSSLHTNAFLGSSIRITRTDANGNPVVSNAQPIETDAGGPGFTPSPGTFTFPNQYTADSDVSDGTYDTPPASDPLFNDAVPAKVVDVSGTNQVSVDTAGYQCPLDGRDTGITVDANNAFTAGTVVGQPDFNYTDASVITGISSPVTNATALQLAACAATGREDNADSTSDPVASTYEILGSNLITVDSESPSLAGSSVTTGIVWRAVQQEEGRGLFGRANSIQLKFTDDGAAAGDKLGSGLDASTVTASAFAVGDNTVNSVLVVRNSVYLTLAENLASDERPSVSVANGVIRDKAGNDFAGQRIAMAVDGLGPNISLAEDTDLSNEEVTVTITSDEQLGAAPTVTLSRVVDRGGTAVGPDAMVCDDSVTTAEMEFVPLNAAGDCPTDPAGVKMYMEVPDTRRPAASATPRQVSPLSFNYTVTSSANPTVEGVVQSGGKYNVYVVARDTHDAANKGKAGHKDNANDAAAFTFQLDTKLNGGNRPEVKVGEADAAESVSNAPEVEAVDPMIVTVDFTKEGTEYAGDSYRTVTLTSAALKFTNAEGVSTTTSLDLTTDVNSPDNIQFTHPVLNPKVGMYELSVEAVDQAGNASITSPSTSTPETLKFHWEVVAAKPVEIDLAPGWNLISLPFQPANPAINSVIPADHPVETIMTFDNLSQFWLVSRRDDETGRFRGDIAVMTANTAYFVQTDNYQPLKILRPSLATAAAAPPPPPSITVVEGWNLVPVVSNEIPTPKVIAADNYFGTLRSGGDNGWLKALTFETLRRTWQSVTPNTFATAITTGDVNPCTAAVETELAASQPCVVDTTPGEDGGLRLQATVTVGKGYWLYATKDGVIIP